MLSVKAVRQKYSPNVIIISLLDTFKKMVNQCIQIGLEENVTSLKSLSVKAYHQLSNYDVPSYYKLCAISSTVGILRNYRKTKRKKPEARIPYARKRMLTTCYGFKLKDNKLRLPIKSHVYEYIPLNRHTLEVLSKPSLTARSVTLTDSTVSINFSKETVEIEPTGLIGIDRNLNNVTVCDNKGNVEQIDLSRATEIKETYRNIKSHFVRNDVRIRRRIFGKYGAKQRNIVSQILHKTSKRIVQEALESKYAIVMENLKGIRKLYRKGNGQGRNYRSRLNSWSFYELQRQIEYKALWEGLPVIYVPARGTSIKCSLCGSALQPIPEENRNLKCSTHGIVDRDVNASRNIVKLGMRFVPIALPSEAMVVECQTETNPQSRWK